MTKTNPETLIDFLKRNGIGDKSTYKTWFNHDLVMVNQRPAGVETVVHADDQLSIRGKQYLVEASLEPGRLTLRSLQVDLPARINRRVRVQCGYHKCLTVFFKRISRKTAFVTNPFSGAFRHFFHRVDEFYQDCQEHTLCSISGHAIDLDRFNDIKAVHIIRDPRDLVVSGYFYHKRAAEDWCDYINPTELDWEIVNGVIPAELPEGTSLSQFLNRVSLEQGLLAEFEFRRKHLQNMLKWPIDDSRVMTLKYEDILGNEVEVLEKMYDFYGFPWRTRKTAALFAGRYRSSSKHTKSSHIRNAGFGQWREYFTPELTRTFNERYGELLSKYGYE